MPLLWVPFPRRPVQPMSQEPLETDGAEDKEEQPRRRGQPNTLQSAVSGLF